MWLKIIIIQENNKEVVNIKSLIIENFENLSIIALTTQIEIKGS